jgi:hypothetical protein
MKLIFAIAAMTIAAPLSAQAVDEEAAYQARAAKAKSCISSTATDLAKTSKESADTLADVTTYRRFMSHDLTDIRSEHRLAALDTIVKARSATN